MRAWERRTVVGLVGVLALVLGATGSAEEPRRSSGRAEMSMEPADPSEAEATRWRVNARDLKDGRSVSGTMKVQGVRVVRADMVRSVNWEASDAGVSGTVSTANGQVVASFRGSVSQEAVKGTFTSVTGESGTWEWEGPIPDAVSNNQVF